MRKTRGRVVRYSFLVGLLHSLLHAGLPRRTEMPAFRPDDEKSVYLYLSEFAKLNECIGLESTVEDSLPLFWFMTRRFDRLEITTAAIMSAPSGPLIVRIDRLRDPRIG